MESVKLLDEHGTFEWEYDAEADVLYLSQDEPCEAIGVDAGEGLLLRYDEATKRLVGLTIVGVRGAVGAEVGPTVGPRMASRLPGGLRALLGR